VNNNKLSFLSLPRTPCVEIACFIASMFVVSNPEYN